VRALLIYNPTAGDEDVDPVELVSPLRAAGYEVDARSIGGDWKTALDGDHELVVVAGGDGAVTKVLKGLAGKGKVAALLPSGSANNIAKTLGYGADEPDEEVIRRFEQAERVAFDLGLVSWNGKDCSFVESAGFGIFADVLVRADEVEDEPGGDEKIEVGLRFLREAAEEAGVFSCQVLVDGADLSGEYIAVEATNVGLVSVNVPVAPDARPDDGLVDLVLLKAADRARLAEYASARLDDRRPPALDFEVHRARRIELRVPPDWPFHLDDELLSAGAKRYSLKVVPGLEVLVPG
jgi:diacylglycerol kinase (ATP)